MENHGQKLLPIGGKENFSIRTLLRIARRYRKRMPWPQISQKKTFANSHKASKFVKFSPLESFPVYGIMPWVVLSLCSVTI